MMQRKTVLFIADSLDNAHKFQSVLSGLDVDVVAGSSAQFKKLLAQHPSHDLVIYEARGDALDTVAQAESLLVEDGSTSMLVIVNEAQLSEFRLPVQIKADFVVHGASAEECAARIRQLAQQALVTHDADIFVDVPRTRRDLHQLKEIRAAAGLVVVAHAREHIQNGYRVNTLCAVEHRVDGLKDALVFFRVKIIGAHLLDDLRNAIRIDQHRA